MVFSSNTASILNQFEYNTKNKDKTVGGRKDLGIQRKESSREKGEGKVKGLYDIH